jgi:NAD-dependent SIR2 family protein deacetylase
MSAAELQFTLTFKVVYCCNKGCGTPIAMPTQVYNRFLENHEFFHCCFGHPQHFSGPSEAEKLKKQLESERETTEWWRQKADQRERSAKAYKGQVTRLKNRVKNGVCPCCHRTFQNLQRHMHTKHPDYASEAPKETDE